MKQVTKTYEVYTFDELDQKAKDKAREAFNQDNDYPFLSDMMNEKLHELLEENDIKDTNDTSKPNIKPTPVFYSLSHCQGDGAMFAGTFLWKKYLVIIKHSGRYSHENSKTLDITYLDNDGKVQGANEKTYKTFDGLYIKICKQLERAGYAEIEYQNSEESFRETCEANEYNFLASGQMVNY